MKIEFADADLRRICTDEAHKLGLPVAVIQAARRKLVQLEAASDERDLRNWKSLNYKKLQGEKDGKRTVRVNDQYRIVFTLHDSEQPPIIHILAICDNH
jgi:proteic killer suppression protein